MLDPKPGRPPAKPAPPTSASSVLQQRYTKSLSNLCRSFLTSEIKRVRHLLDCPQVSFNWAASRTLANVVESHERGVWNTPISLQMLDTKEQIIDALRHGFIRRRQGNLVKQSRLPVLITIVKWKVTRLTIPIDLIPHVFFNYMPCGDTQLTKQKLIRQLIDCGLMHSISVTN